MKQEDAIRILSDLTTPLKVAQFFSMSLRRFNYHIYIKPAPYRMFAIPKKTGGQRKIMAPPRLIKIMQRILAKHLRDAYPNRSEVFGFNTDGGIVKNASRHVGARAILNLDLENFFTTITFARVHGMFKAPPLCIPHTTAAILAKLSAHYGNLPQGSPTSPIISNYICRRLDTRLRRLAIKHRCRYTRYADDITFSTRRASLPTEILKSQIGQKVEIGNELRAAIEENNFTINAKKVWVRTARERQEVTGLLVNSKINVRRGFILDIRGALHNWSHDRIGPAFAEFAAKYDKGGRPPEPDLFANHIQGKLAFIQQVRGKHDAIFARYALQFNELCIRDGLINRIAARLSGEAAANENVLRHALWIIRVYDNDRNPVAEGTGFSLEGDGIITCAHVISNDELGTLPKGYTITVVRGSDGRNTEVPATLTKFSQRHDLALLSADVEHYAVFMAAKRAPKVEDNVLLVGYPEWRNNILDIPRRQRGHITHTQKVSMVNWFTIGATVRKGNSGGPVINEEGFVVGVAARGKNPPTLKGREREEQPLEDAAVSIEHVADMKPV